MPKLWLHPSVLESRTPQYHVVQPSGTELSFVNTNWDNDQPNVDVDISLSEWSET